MPYYKNEENVTNQNYEPMNEILSGKVCPYCGKPTEYVDSSIVYGRSYGMIYLCRDCRAYVGAHKGTDQALGRLANAELREAKKEAHFYFDQIAKTNLINKIWKKHIPNTSNRNKAYLWLSIQLGIPREICHIGMRHIYGCQRKWAYHGKCATSECSMWRIANELLNCVNR